METREDHGRLEGSTDGILVLPKTITGAIYTSYPIWVDRIVPPQNINTFGH
jgi:hypothetical protein